MRYFSELSYKGTNYHGWQKQHNAISVQGTIEDAFSTILGRDFEVVGCGRTDTGVHASQYFMHFDFDGSYPKSFIARVNRLLPSDISIRRIFEVDENAHARFDAVQRSYEYHLVLTKQPFESDTAWHFTFGDKLDMQKLELAASLLTQYEEFAPFCKTHSDTRTMRCELLKSKWEVRDDEEKLIYHVSANRFLRGMVRLIVGMCLNVAMGKLELDVVKRSLENQEPLCKSWSVPAHGLFLSEVIYKS